MTNPTTQADGRGSMKTFYLDPDFRRNVDTSKTYCHVCQKRVTGEKKFVWVSGAADNWTCAFHPSDKPNDAERAVVGPECARRIPPEFIVS